MLHVICNILKIKQRCPLLSYVAHSSHLYSTVFMKNCDSDFYSPLISYAYSALRVILSLKSPSKTWNVDIERLWQEENVSNSRLIMGCECLGMCCGLRVMVPTGLSWVMLRSRGRWASVSASLAWSRSVRHLVKTPLPNPHVLPHRACCFSSRSGFTKPPPQS